LTLSRASRRAISQPSASPSPSNRSSRTCWRRSSGSPPGPQVAGGIYAYEQYERVFPRINNPLAQPYGAFTTGQVATLAVEALIEKYVAEKMAKVVGAALREQAERDAREEVARALAEYAKK